VQPSAEPAYDAVVRLIIDLERICLEADSALVERRWPDVEASFRAQAELTGRLARLFESAPETAPANDAKVAERVRGILVYRDDQLRRLESCRDEIAARLSAIGKLNAFSRSFGKRAAAAQLLDGQY
jgi:hypothetical protein